MNLFIQNIKKQMKNPVSIFDTGFFLNSSIFAAIRNI